MWVRDKNSNLIKINRSDYPSDKLFYIQLMSVMNNKSFKQTDDVLQQISCLINYIDQTVEKNKY